MGVTSVLECSFFVPLTRDINLADGAAHETTVWDWLDNELFERFGGGTIAPGTYRGFYTDPDTQQRVGDESYRYIVAVPISELDNLRKLLQAVCVLFAQKCIYLSVSGHVEFISPSHPS
ncbi:MAG: hypothetical protein JNM18_06400 [Planctomycetaceae bacterium]|nr:hypothetical protein [Planctomycetaceae bacterium]